MSNVVFDSLGYVKTLAESGVPREQAEAHATVARNHILGFVSTKDDLEVLERRLETKLSELELRMTLRFGGMLVAAVGIVIAAQKLL